MPLASVTYRTKDAARPIAVLEHPKKIEGRNGTHCLAEEPTQVAKVLVVDDHPIVRAGIRCWIRECPDLNIVGEADSGEKAIELGAQLHPDVILLDLVLPGMTGLETLRTLRELVPDAKVVVLTSLVAGDAVRDALQAGAIGYHLKGASMDVLVKAIRSSTRNEATLDANAARGLAQAATPARCSLSS